MTFDQTPIRFKLGAIVVVFAIPIAILAWLFIQQSLKEIQFGQKERDGITYMRGVWPVVNALLLASNNQKTAPASLLSGVPDFAVLGQNYDAAMDSAEGCQHHELAGGAGSRRIADRACARAARSSQPER